MICSLLTHSFAPDALMLLGSNRNTGEKKSSQTSAITAAIAAHTTATRAAMRRVSAFRCSF